jgi:CHAT domain-containing protein/Tfp pilus assembly protein PilF
LAFEGRNWPGRDKNRQICKSRVILSALCYQSGLGVPIMRNSAAAVLAAFASALFAFSVAAQEPGTTATPPSGAQDASQQAELDRLAGEASRLMQAGKFAEAIEPAKKALDLSQTLHGEQSIKTAIATHNLGFLLKRIERTDEARDYLERAWRIYDSQLPAVHEDVRNIVGELGLIYQAQGRSGEVVRIYTSLIERAEREGYGSHIGTAHHHNNLAFVLRGLKQFDESQKHWEQAIAIYVQQTLIDAEAYHLAVDALLDAYRRSADFDKALAIGEQALNKLGGQDPSKKAIAASIAISLADAGHAAGRYAESKSWAGKAIEALEALPESEREGLPEALNSLARAERALANYAAAAQHYTRAMTLMEAQGKTANVGILSDNLAVLYSDMGQLDQAEKNHKRALQLLEQSLGRDHRVVGEAAGNFGALLLVAGRYAESEPLLLRSLKIAEAQSPQDPVTIAIVNDHLAAIYRQTDRWDEAGVRLRQSLALMEQALPEIHPRIATTRTNLGRHLIDTKAYKEAETQLKKALAIEEQVYGPDHPAPGVAHGNLGDLYFEMGRRNEAKAQFKQALDVLTKRLGPTHATLLVPLVQSGTAELADGNVQGALAAFQQAVTIDLADRARGAGLTPTGQREMRSERRAYAGLIEVLWKSTRDAKARDVARALDAGQWETISPAGLALTALAARSSAGDPALGALVREWQDLAVEWTGRDKRLTEILSQTGARDSTLETSLRTRLEAIETRRAAISQDLTANFPRFGALATPSPVPIAEAQALLAPNEAAVQFYVSENATHVWVLTKTETRWERLAVKEDELSTLVHALRCGLDRSEWRDDGKAACAKLLGRDVNQAPKNGAPLPFDLDRARGLYKVLIEPIADAIKDKDLLIVPSGPLTAMPFGVLVAAKPSSARGYAKASWLIKDHAITMLPSLASLKALRQSVKLSQAAKPFLGVGNPLLTGVDGTDKRAWDNQSCASTSAPKPTGSPGFSIVAHIESLFRGGLANVAALRQQPALPETADELCTVARFLNADDRSVLLGAAANEHDLKKLSDSGALAGARVVHFATHGLLAGETALFSGARAEPALLLTPPDTATPEDDGLLMASEVAALKLDADWVVLSACNTAGGDGAGAESLSGLARAFFYAGARAMLVSHWAVDSEAAVKLVTGSFGEMSKDTKIGRAQALRRATLAVIASSETSAHPAYWAPFVVVGEGGAADRNADVISAAPVSAAPLEEKTALPVERATTPVEKAAPAPVEKTALPLEKAAPLPASAVSEPKAAPRNVVAPATAKPKDAEQTAPKARPSKPRAKPGKPPETWSPKMFGDW